MDSNLEKSMQSLNWLVGINPGNKNSSVENNEDERSEKSSHQHQQTSSSTIEASSPECFSISSNNSNINSPVPMSGNPHLLQPPLLTPPPPPPVLLEPSTSSQYKIQGRIKNSKSSQKSPKLHSDNNLPTLSSNNSTSSPKPPHSYAELINLAISSSDRKMMTLSEIYSYILNQFPYFKTCQSRWKNSIRHNLSLNRNFIRVPRPKDESGKGSYWTLAKFRGSHAAALNELHQKQLANLSESFRQLYQETFQPALLSTGMMDDITKTGNQVVVNPKAAQIAIKNEKEESMKKKDVQQMKNLGVGNLDSLNRIKKVNSSKIVPKLQLPKVTPVKTSFSLESTPIVTPQGNNLRGPPHLAHPPFVPVCNNNFPQNIQSAFSEVEKNLNKSVNLLKNKNWSKKELEPYSDLMASMAKAEADKWDLTPNDLSTLYEGINKFCSDQSQKDHSKNNKGDKDKVMNGFQTVNIKFLGLLKYFCFKTFSYPKFERIKSAQCNFQGNQQFENGTSKESTSAATTVSTCCYFTISKCTHRKQYYYTSAIEFRGGPRNVSLG